MIESYDTESMINYGNMSSAAGMKTQYGLAAAAHYHHHYYQTQPMHQHPQMQQQMQQQQQQQQMGNGNFDDYYVNQTESMNGCAVTGQTAGTTDGSPLQTAASSHDMMMNKTLGEINLNGASFAHHHHHHNHNHNHQNMFNNYKRASLGNAVAQLQLLNFPIIENTNWLDKFQMMLMAATSPAVKINEETLTYLNQGQKYELKLAYFKSNNTIATGLSQENCSVGFSSALDDAKAKTSTSTSTTNTSTSATTSTGDDSSPMFMSIIRLCFWDRKLQEVEYDEIKKWKKEYQSVRMLELENNSSNGYVEIRLPEMFINIGEVMWRGETGANLIIQCNCTSTAFAPHKHGGEKGIHMRLQIDTYEIVRSNNNETKGLSAGIVVKDDLAGGECVQSQTNASTSKANDTCSSSPSPSSPAPTVSNQLFDHKLARKHLCSSYCRIQLFRLKGAQRKLKTDKFKLDRLNPIDLRKRYQMSCKLTHLYNSTFDSLYSTIPSLLAETMDTLMTHNLSIPECESPPPSAVALVNQTNSFGNNVPYHGPNIPVNTLNGLYDECLPSSLVVNDFLETGTNGMYASAGATNNLNGTYDMMNTSSHHADQMQPGDMFNNATFDNATHAMVDSAALKYPVNNMPDQLIVNTRRKSSFTSKHLVNFPSLHPSTAPYPMRNPNANNNKLTATKSAALPNTFMLQSSSCSLSPSLSSSSSTSSSSSSSSFVSSPLSPQSPLITSSSSEPNMFLKQQQQSQLASNKSAPLMPAVSSGYLTQQPAQNTGSSSQQLQVNCNCGYVQDWLATNRFYHLLNLFASYTSNDMLRLSKDDLIKICGPPDGIRLFNLMHNIQLKPKLNLFVTFNNKTTAYFYAVYFNGQENKLKYFLHKLIRFYKSYVENRPDDEYEDVFEPGSMVTSVNPDLSDQSSAKHDSPLPANTFTIKKESFQFNKMSDSDNYQHQQSILFQLNKNIDDLNVELFVKVNEILVKVTEDVLNNFNDKCKFLIEFDELSSYSSLNNTTSNKQSQQSSSSINDDTDQNSGSMSANNSLDDVPCPMRIIMTQLE